MKGNEVVKEEGSASYCYVVQNMPDLMTEEELIHFLRIPDVSTAKDYSNVIANLIRMRDLPRIHICNKLLYPKKAILEWVEKEINRN
jgi:hypothetical protein